MVLRKSFYIRWSAGRSPRVHEVNPGRDPSVALDQNGAKYWAVGRGSRGQRTLGFTGARTGLGLWRVLRMSRVGFGRAWMGFGQKTCKTVRTR